MRHPLLAGSFALSTAMAQIPTDSAIVLETTTALYVPNYRIVDLLGGGNTTMRNQNVWTLPSPISVATDPASPVHFFFQTNPASLAGSWRNELGLLGRSLLATWGPWQQGPADRIEVSTSHVITLTNGVVAISPRVGGGPVQTLFLLANARDLAVVGSLLYVAAFDPSTPAPVIEFQLPSGPMRTVGNYVGVRALGASPILPVLCLGTHSGDLVHIDAVTGGVLSNTATGLGSIVAVGYTRFGTLVWADATELHSELVPGGPVYVSPTNAIVDFGVARAITATVTPFGDGCGLGSTADWNANSLPTLGNATFQLGLVGGPANALVALVLGDSRYQSSLLGVPLPFDLAPFGAVGCRLSVNPVVPLAYVSNNQGAVAQIVPIPANPTLAGIEFVAQWFVADANVGPLGMATTSGVAFVVR